jgi:hypothetical protein
MHRRDVLRLAGGGFIAAAVPTLVGCDTTLPDAAVAAWRGPGAEADPRRWILAHAILAPHSHNLQSWLVDLREPDTVVLRLDLQRLLPETDPLSRQMVMSQGTFLELLDLAARERGLRAEIVPFPDGPFEDRRPDHRPTARVRLVPDASLEPDPLFRQVFARRTNRAAYDGRAPSAEALKAMQAAVAGLPVTVGFSDPGQADAHRRIAADAWRIELTTPRTLLETYRWLRIGPEEIKRHRDGLSLNDPMVRALTAAGLFDRTKPSAPDSRAIRGQIRDFERALASTPSFHWMTSRDNTRQTQLAAGRAWARVQLAATAHGVAMHPMQQALQEYPEQAVPYAAIHRLVGAPGETVQMWARVGYGPAVGPSPRRGVDAHLTTA